MSVREQLLARMRLDVPCDGPDTLDQVDGLLAVASSLLEIAGAIQRLGNGDAATHFGAIEAHTMQVGQRLTELAGAVAPIGEALQAIADTLPRIVRAARD